MIRGVRDLYSKRDAQERGPRLRVRHRSLLSGDRLPRGALRGKCPGLMFERDGLSLVRPVIGGCQAINVPSRC